ncbi:uncharacterized protein LOC107716427 [Sinocyclocheilus rhinocerous]|uniref:uncharacterized protein LOC107716427 n=1 Tax=Sinocyclocheilus rhinocerous TaxID=307959 RepID=UPI0007B7B1F4|nr:PREDICTED: uncharacterized protein LOC107716427 [Sinocyclocheilus rhinocerous]
MDTVTADIQTAHPWSLLFADNVFLASKDRQQLQDQMQQWKTRLDKYGLWLNIKKTEYMECGPQTNGTISIDGKDLKAATNFKYLGSVISSDGDTLPDARTRVNATWMKWDQPYDGAANMYIQSHIFSSNSRFRRTINITQTIVPNKVDSARNLCQGTDYVIRLGHLLPLLRGAVLMLTCPLLVLSVLDRAQHGHPDWMSSLSKRTKK